MLMLLTGNISGSNERPYVNHQRAAITSLALFLFPKPRLPDGTDTGINVSDFETTDKRFSPREIPGSSYCGEQGVSN